MVQDKSKGQMEKVQNQPILFIALGTGGIKVLAEFPRAAQSISVRVAGPFGSIYLKHPGQAAQMSHCCWLSDLNGSATPLPVECDTDPQAKDSGDAILTGMRSLIRRLNCGIPDRVQSGISHARVQGYVIVDLNTPNIIPSAIQLIQFVRRVEPSMELTGLALTSRTGMADHAQTERWFEQCTALLRELQAPYLLQRLYLLDGIDARGNWLPSLEHLYHVGAQFILHHGLSPHRHHLRRREKTRTNFQESFLNYCGSAACRQFSSDRSTIEKCVAAVLVRDQKLIVWERGSLTPERGHTLDGWAGQLASEIASICDNDASARHEQDARRKVCDSDEDREVVDAISKMLTAVCAEEPVLSLRWFLKSIGQQFRELMAFSQLRMRWDARYRAAKSSQNQVHPADPQIEQWGTQAMNPLAVTLSCPPPKDFYAMGMLGVGLGLTLLGLGAFLQQMSLIVLGGITAIVACIFRVLGTGWRECECKIIPHEQTMTEPVPEQEYTRCMPGASRWGAAVLLGVGIAYVGWSMWPVWPLGRESIADFCGPASIICAMAGAAVLLMSRICARGPGPASLGRYAPDLAPPLSRNWYYAGLALFTVAWTLLCLCQGSSTVYGNMGVLSVGLLLIWTGLALAFYPRIGTTKLVHRVSEQPLSANPGPTKSMGPSYLLAQDARLQSWAEGIICALEPQSPQSSSSQSSALNTSILDMFSPQWANRLAEAFEHDLQTGSEKSLAEMAKQPALWAECVIQGLLDLQIEVRDPLYLFALHQVKRWLGGKSWEQIIAYVNPEPSKIVDAGIAAAVPPHWPQTRMEPEVDMSLITVGNELWTLIAPFVDKDSACRFEKVEWQEPHTMTVTRIVQGLSGGWRSYEGLPGQSNIRTRSFTTKRENTTKAPIDPQRM